MKLRRIALALAVMPALLSWNCSAATAVDPKLLPQESACAERGLSPSRDGVNGVVQVRKNACPALWNKVGFDKQGGYLVAYPVWVSEPQQEFREKVGLGVLFFLAVLLVVVYALKRAYWKGVH